MTQTREEILQTIRNVAAGRHGWSGTSSPRTQPLQSRILRPNVKLLRHDADTAADDGPSTFLRLDKRSEHVPKLRAVTFTHRTRPLLSRICSVVLDTCYDKDIVHMVRARGFACHGGGISQLAYPCLLSTQ